jgi:hypothetical protein
MEIEKFGCIKNTVGVIFISSLRDSIPIAAGFFYNNSMPSALC